MRGSIVLALTLVAACSRQQPQLEVASATNPAPCESSRLPADAEGDWVSARGDGFTYCVPASWKPIGPRATRWTSNTVDVSWGETGAFVRSGPFVISRGGPTGGPPDRRVVTENVDGKTVRLEITDGGGSALWIAAASFLEPALRFRATARSASASREVLGVIRSVRFAK